MNPNPFSPSFAILPSSFYGRGEYLDSYAKALDTPNSAYRFFFLTGTRGSGKTSLLHQYELLAAKRRWDVIKATNIDALDRMLRYVGLDKETTKTAAFEPSASVAGAADVSLGKVSASSSSRPSVSMLGIQLIKKLRGYKTKRGLAIIIDEAQKLSREDTVRISNAVQDVKLEGLPVSLVLCGLPSAYSKLRSYKDCTFIRRMKRVKLWAMLKSETLDCLRQMFATLPEISLTEEQLSDIAKFTGGHPYLIQLFGDNLYNLVEREINPLPGMVVSVPSDFIGEAEAKALVEYKENILDDVLSGVHKGTTAYIEAAFNLRDGRGRANVAAINESLGKSAQEASSQRANALNTQVLKQADRGQVKFALPHYDLIFEPYEYETPETNDDEWDY